MCCFGSQNHEEMTIMKLLKELQDNNIDINQLVEMKADNCQ
jgi:hypothetical protein